MVRIGANGIKWIARNPRSYLWRTCPISSIFLPVQSVVDLFLAPWPCCVSGCVPVHILLCPWVPFLPYLLISSYLLSISVSLSLLSSQLQCYTVAVALPCFCGTRGKSS
ncbi:unnamed protein product [Sphacelaria rigidula]